MDDVRPLRPGELLAGLAEVQHQLAGPGEARGRALGDVVDDAEHRDHRGGQDRGLAGLVVEADVAAGHRDAEGRAGVLEPAAGLGELPHHGRVLGRAEVEAVRDRDQRWSPRSSRRCGRPRPARAAPRRTGRAWRSGRCSRSPGDPEPGLLVDADHPAVAGLRQHRVAAHVAVVLVGDPGLVAEVGRGGQPQHGGPQLVAARGARQRLGAVGLQGVLPGRSGERAARRPGPSCATLRGGDVDDGLAVPVDVQPPGRRSPPRWRWPRRPTSRRWPGTRSRRRGRRPPSCVPGSRSSRSPPGSARSRAAAPCRARRACRRRRRPPARRWRTRSRPHRSPGCPRPRPPRTARGCTR